MMGTHHHHHMIVPIAGKELGQALMTIMTPEAARKGITSLDTLMFILITIMLLIMDINQGIEKHVPFVVYLTIPFLSGGKEWQHS